MRLLNKHLRKSLSAVWARQRLGALLCAAIVVASVASAGAAETYRGSDPDSYECSSDFNILNRFSAPPGVSAARSTKYLDIRFTLENNVISVKDASNSRELAYIAVGEGAKYCVFKDIQSYDRAKEFLPTTERCAIKYFIFRLRIVIDAELPVRAFSLPGLPPEFDKMDHIVDIDVYRAMDRRKSVSAAGCNEVGDSPDSPFFAIGNHGLRTANKSALNVIEEAPFGYASSVYERQALEKAEPKIPRPK